MRDLLDLFEGVTTLDHILKWQRKLREVCIDMERVERAEGKIEKVSDLQDCIWKVTEILEAYADKLEAAEEARRAEAERLDAEEFGNPDQN